MSTFFSSFTYLGGVNKMVGDLPRFPPFFDSSGTVERKRDPSSPSPV